MNDIFNFWQAAFSFSLNPNFGNFAQQKCNTRLKDVFGALPPLAKNPGKLRIDELIFTRSAPLPVGVANHAKTYVFKAFLLC